jgi:hypothetical protein
VEPEPNGKAYGGDNADTTRNDARDGTRTEVVAVAVVIVVVVVVVVIIVVAARGVTASTLCRSSRMGGHPCGRGNELDGSFGFCGRLLAIVGVMSSSIILLVLGLVPFLDSVIRVVNCCCVGWVALDYCGWSIDICGWWVNIARRCGSIRDKCRGWGRDNCRSPRWDSRRGNPGVACCGISRSGIIPCCRSWL